ncbi:MAG: hypothetical protein H6973_17495 [Gammaproteobacteria bacterium]|nr:hypothetical protein [Gammaproteobacteria bacterium]
MNIPLLFGYDDQAPINHQRVGLVSSADPDEKIIWMTRRFIAGFDLDYLVIPLRVIREPDSITVIATTRF